jgi:hypothetical protein
LLYKNTKAWLNAALSQALGKYGLQVQRKLNDFGLNATVADGLPHGHQLIPAAFFHRALTFEVDNPSALFGLLGCVLAYFDERLNHVVKGIHIVIENDQIVHLFFHNNCIEILKYGGCFFG